LSTRNRYPEAVPNSNFKRLLTHPLPLNCFLIVPTCGDSYTQWFFLSPADGNEMNRAGGARIKCQYKLGEDSIEATWLNTDVTKLDLVHV